MFPQKDAIRAAGISKAEYSRSKRNLEKILDVGQILDISKICVKLGIPTHIQKLAETLKSEFFAQNSNLNLDLEHPQYYAMAIYQACKIEKIKKPNSDLIKQSHLKYSEWKKLEIQWTKFVENRKVAITSIKPTATCSGDSTNISNKPQTVTSQPKQETYDVWRKNIIERAFDDLVDTKEINYLHINILKYILQLNTETYERAIKYFKDFCSTFVLQTSELLDAKYACILVFKAALDMEFDVSQEKLREYSKLSRSEWKKLKEEWDENVGECIGLDDMDPEIKHPKFDVWYKSTFNN